MSSSEEVDYRHRASIRPVRPGLRRAAVRGGVSVACAAPFAALPPYSSAHEDTAAGLGATHRAAAFEL
jgi:hypothetical protein